MHPKNRLRQPCAWLHRPLLRTVVRAPVEQEGLTRVVRHAAAQHEVDALRVLPTIERLLALLVGALGHGRGTYLHDDILLGDFEPLEDGVVEVRGVDLVAQLHLQRHRQRLERRDVGLVHAHVLDLVRPQEAQDLVAEPQRDLVLGEVPAQAVVCLHPVEGLLAAHVQQCRGAAEQRGEEDQAYEEHADREGALGEVHGVEVVGRRRELRHSPMETERVQVPSGVFRAFQVREPRHHALRLRVHADRVPSARDEVRADRQAHQEPDDLEEGEQWGREDEVENSLHDVEELQQTHHASHPNAPRDPHQSGRFANAHHVHGLDAVDELEDQVRGDHEQIEPEPSSQVLAGDLVYPHLGAPVRELEAHEEV
mmetsp:Transcript_172835/g.554097  ORF Transcript_172835/g.554097 Transcript_172835/m.554097 type:complete len:368 (-) Transcript_172835:922-2025(-)